MFLLYFQVDRVGKANTEPLKLTAHYLQRVHPLEQGSQGGVA